MEVSFREGDWNGKHSTSLEPEQGHTPNATRCNLSRKLPVSLHASEYQYYVPENVIK